MILYIFLALFNILLYSLIVLLRDKKKFALDEPPVGPEVTIKKPLKKQEEEKEIGPAFISNSKGKETPQIYH